MDKLIELISATIPAPIFWAVILVAAISWFIRAFYNLSSWSETFRSKDFKISFISIVIFVLVYYLYSVFFLDKFCDCEKGVVITNIKHDKNYLVQTHIADALRMKVKNNRDNKVSVRSIERHFKNNLDAIKYCESLKASLCITGSFINPILNLQITPVEGKDISADISLEDFRDTEVFTSYLARLLNWIPEHKNTELELTTIKKISLNSKKKKILLKTKRYFLKIGTNKFESSPEIVDSNPIQKVITSIWPNTNLVNLIGKNTTFENINKSMLSIKREVTKDDEVWVFLSGNIVLKGKIPYFIPSDGAFTQNFIMNAIPLSNIYEWFNSLPTKNNMLVIDGCYSGKIFNYLALSRGKKNPIFKGDTQLKNTFILTSSGADEVSYSVKDFNTSIFSYVFLQGIKGEADYNNDGVIQGREVGLYVKERVRFYANSYHFYQNPRFITTANFDNDDMIINVLR